MKMLRRRDGTIVIEERIERWFNRPTRYDDGVENLMPDLPSYDYNRPIRVGDEGCLAIVKNVSPDSLRAGETEINATLRSDAAGLPGNSNPNITRLHGWRGTSNDCHVSAHGWRRVLSIRPVARGIGYRVILSADLQPDEA